MSSHVTRNVAFQDYAFEHYFELAQREKGISSHEVDSSLFERLAANSESEESEDEGEMQPQTDAQRLDSTQAQSDMSRADELFDKISSTVREAEKAWSNLPEQQNKPQSPRVHFQ